MAQRREYRGSAVKTRPTAAINSTDMTFGLADTTGWPTGSIGPFWVTFDKSMNNEEKILVASRSGSTCTVMTGGRGGDGTTASSHAITATVQHTIAASDIDLVNAHAADVSRDDHTQYVHVSTARTISAVHDFTSNVIFSADPVFSGDPTLSGTPHFTGVPDFANMGAVGDISTVDTGARAAGTSPLPARADHKHNLDKIALLRTMWRAGDFKIDPVGDAVDTWELAEWLDPAVVTTFNRTAYPELWTRYGTKFGVGDGSTTAGLPTVKDLMLSATGNVRLAGGAGGADTVTLATNNLPAHNHVVTDPGHNHSVTDPTHKHLIDGDGGNRVVVTGGSTYWVTVTNPHDASQNVSFTDIDPALTGVTINSNTTGITTQNTGSGTAVATVPKWFGVRVLIKAH